MKRCESGAAKRKRKRLQEEDAKRQRNALCKFLTGAQASEQETETNDISDCDNETETNTDIFVGQEIDSLPVQENDASACTSIEQNKNGILDVDVQLETKSQMTPVSYPSDIALWPSFITDKMIDFYLLNKPKNIGDLTDLKIEYEDRNRTYCRSFQESNFYYIKANGEKERREWLIFTETSKSIYCYVCKLFSRSSKFATTGFNDWRNVNKCLKEHEHSPGIIF